MCHSLKCPEQTKKLPNLHLKLDLVFSFHVVVYRMMKLILMAIVQTVLLDPEIFLLRLLLILRYFDISKYPSVFFPTISPMLRSSVGAILITLLIAFSQE